MYGDEACMDSSRAGSEPPCTGLQQALSRSEKLPQSREPQVTLNVTFKNETQSSLVSNSENTTQVDVKAMVMFCLV